MVIDFHTHILPDKVYQRAYDAMRHAILQQTGKMGVTYASGNYDGLKKSMKENGIDYSVVLPVVTKPNQTESIIHFAEEVNRHSDETGIISFAGIFPGQEGWEGYLEDIKAKGFKGIKIHPEYQSVYVDSPEGIALFQKCEELELYCTLHAGNDIGLDPPVHSMPEMLNHVLDYVSGKYIIAAHLGGWKAWDDVEQYLVGSQIYLDTAFTCTYIEKEQYKRIIQNHGSEKILLASDSPWENPATSLAGVKALGLSQEEEENIVWKNGAQILGLDI